MLTVDAEWYLRRCAEDEVVTGADAGLGYRAHALVAVGLLPAELAGSILRTYLRARALRGHDHDESSGRGTAFLPAASYLPPRMLACGRTVAQPWGKVTIDCLALDAKRTRVGVTAIMWPGAHGSGRRARGAHYLPGGPPAISIGDDRGRRHAADFSGHGSDREYTGYYTTGAALPSTTAWLTVFGERIDLADGPSSDVSVSIAALPIADSVEARAEHHLARLAEAGSHWERHPVSELSTAVDTFLACGIVQPDDEAVRRAFAVRDLIGGNHAGRALLTPRWRSVAARRGRSDGPVGTRIVGATTPVFDDVRVAVLRLRSDASDVEVEFEAAGRIDGRWVADPQWRRLVVTATDDRGNHYLAGLREWGSGSDGMHGTIEFGAPLDRAASWLELRIPMVTACANIRIPLVWDRAR